MLESTVETSLVRGGKRRGVWVIKAERLHLGFPDRMLLAPGGRVAFVELKRPKRVLEPAQRLVRRWLKHLGFRVEKLDTPEKVERFLEDWLDG